MASTLLNNNPLRAGVCLTLGLLPGMAGAASDWKATAGLSLSERYTDNVSLVASGAESAFITQVSPRVGLSRRGKRGGVNLAYSLNGLLYDSGRNDLTHDLSAGMNVEPVTGVFKVNGSARVGQQYASRFLPTATDAYHTVGNRVETRSMTLTPSLHNEFFGRGLITDVSLGLNYASSDSALLNTSTGSTLKAALRNGPRPTRWSYAANYSRNSGDSNGVPTSVFESQSYNLGYAVYKKTRVFLSGGRNSAQGVAGLRGRGGDYASTGVSWSPNDYSSLTASVGESGGTTLYGLSGAWSPSRKLNLGATLGRRNNATSHSLNGAWTPDALTSLSASAQKNFDSNTFGVEGETNGLSAYGYTAYALNLNHRVRRAVLGLRYSESVVDASQQFDQTVYFPFYQCAGGVFKPIVAGEPPPSDCTAIVGVPDTVTQLLNQTTYNKTLAGTLNYSLGRSVFVFTLSQSRRQYIGNVGGGEDEQTSFAATWTRPFSGRTSTSLGFNWSTAEAATQQSDAWSVNWSLAHQISPHVSGSLQARHSQQDSNGATGNITENTVSAQLGMTF